MSLLYDERFGSAGAVRLAPQVLTAVTGATVTIPSGTSRLVYRLCIGTSNAVTAVTCTLTGVSASYKNIQEYQTMPSLDPTGYPSAATNLWSMGSSTAGNVFNGDVGLRNGFYRTHEVRESNHADGLFGAFHGSNSDTTNAATALVFAWGATLVTGYLEAWVWP